MSYFEGYFYVELKHLGRHVDICLSKKISGGESWPSGSLSGYVPAGNVCFRKSRTEGN